MSERRSPRPDYVRRVNRAIDYIIEHLDQPLRLEAVARAAHFSPFHFHRVFRSLMGETLQQFIRRVRLERALKMMSHEPQRTLTDVALSCGFASSSDFSRSFKQRYGVAPSALDLESLRDAHRTAIHSAVGLTGQGYQLDRLPVEENPDGFEVEIRDLPARTVAYRRVLEPYREGRVVEAAEQLVRWAERRGCTEQQWLGYMWDDPEVVDLKDCRYDVGLEVEHVEPEGEIGRFDFPPMRVAQLEVRGDLELEIRALDWLFGSWLPRSGYVPTEQPSFEAWIGRPFAHGQKHFELYVQLPVRRS